MNVTEKDERIEAMMPHVKALLGLMNEDPEREGLIKTPSVSYTHLTLPTILLV